MRHYIDGAEVLIYCGHPDIECNECPTRHGDCATCRHCKITFDYLDFCRFRGKGEEEEDEREYKRLI